MTKAKIDVDDMVQDILKSKRVRPKNWIDGLDTDGREFVFKLRAKKEQGSDVSSARVTSKLKEHFGVIVSDSQVRRFLRGELYAEEDFKEESSSSNR